MKQRVSRVLGALVALALFSGLVPAAQAFEMSLVGVGDLSRPALGFNGTTMTGSSSLALGAGVLVGLDMGMISELEIGALYASRDYTYLVASGKGEDSYSRYEIPVIWRFKFLPYLTFGPGLYYSVPTGTYTYTQTPSGQPGTATNSPAIDSFKDDFGAIGSIALKVPLSSACSALVDGRYEYGLVNTTKAAGETFKTRDIEILAGFNFGF